MDNRSIGIFDSGLGGLTILNAISHVLPLENIVYLGDQAHFPYGDKGPEECIEHSLRCAAFLGSKNVKLIIIACHTATAIALKKIQSQFSIPVIGVINSKLNLNRYKKVAILGTKRTVASKVYESLISTETFSLACPEFVVLIENGLENESEALSIAKKVLAPLIGNIDAALLACTHFPIMQNIIQVALGSEVALIDPSLSCAQKAHEILKMQSLLQKSNKTPTYQFYTTGELEIFEYRVQRFLDETIAKNKEFMKLLVASSENFYEVYT